MALTKAEIAESIQQEMGFTRIKAFETVETLLEIMKMTLAEGEDILISGFGKFCVRHKGSRRGRNPATGEEMILPPRKVVTFKCSGKLRKKIDS